MDTQPPQPGPSGSKSGQLADASSNMSLIGTQQERRHQLVHREASDAATKHMTEDAHLKVVRKTGRSTHKKPHAVGCEYLGTAVNSRQLTV
jgi:seryl-tRNA(Sec) selenium transferase